MTKEEIRIASRARKALLSAAERAQAARTAFELLERHAAFQVAERVLLYHSLPDELDTREFISRWDARKQFYLPRVNGVNLDILPYNRSRMRLGAFRIEEPEGDEVADAGVIDLVIVPAVAYDGRGNRVGRGKGYYDRLLPSITATRIGMAYDCQLFDEIDAEPCDVPVDFIITECRVIATRRR